MEAIGYQVSKAKVNEEADRLIQALEAVVQENTVGEKFIHSLVFTWDEAFMVEPKLIDLSKGDNPVFHRRCDSYLTDPRKDIDWFGTYKGIQLYVAHPVRHITPVQAKSPVE